MYPGPLLPRRSWKKSKSQIRPYRNIPHVPGRPWARRDGQSFVLATVLTSLHPWSCSRHTFSIKWTSSFNALLPSEWYHGTRLSESKGTRRATFQVAFFPPPPALHKVRIEKDRILCRALGYFKSTVMV